MFATKRMESVPQPPPFWHDGTERPIHRPTDPEEQQEYYSGKKTCHTVKNRLVINETCHICFLSHTCEGKAAAKSMAELAGDTLPPGSCRIKRRASRAFFCRASRSSNRRKH